MIKSQLVSFALLNLKNFIFSGVSLYTPLVIELCSIHPTSILRAQAKNVKSLTDHLKNHKMRFIHNHKLLNYQSTQTSLLTFLKKQYYSCSSIERLIMYVYKSFFLFLWYSFFPFLYTIPYTKRMRNYNG